MLIVLKLFYYLKFCRIATGPQALRPGGRLRPPEVCRVHAKHHLRAEGKKFLLRTKKTRKANLIYFCKTTKFLNQIIIIRRLISQVFEILNTKL